MSGRKTNGVAPGMGAAAAPAERPCCIDAANAMRLRIADWLDEHAAGHEHAARLDNSLRSELQAIARDERQKALKLRQGRGP